MKELDKQMKPYNNDTSAFEMTLNSTNFTVSTSDPLKSSKKQSLVELDELNN
jgi:hypothetical protein